MIERLNEADYVAVFKGNPGACWSSVGRQGGRQQLSLGQGCADIGVVVHEFMHAIGKPQTTFLRSYTFKK